MNAENRRCLLRDLPLLLLCGLFLLLACLPARATYLLSYQGRVILGGVNFQGTGRFKFALVDHSGVISFWSNDGSGIGGSEPTSSVPVSVSQGLYSVLLGDTNMLPISPIVFSNAYVSLRVWFSDGTNNFQQLAPEQRIVAVGYAMMSPAVADGGITSSKIAPGAVGTLQLADNSVTAAKLAPGSISFSNFFKNTFVPIDGAILSSNRNDPVLLSAGYVKIRDLQTGGGGEVWLPRSTAGAPSPRHSHTAIWTGIEMIVWGGVTWGGGLIHYQNDGARFNPLLNSWKPISTSNAPSARALHTAVWTGKEMIVWGGSDANNQFGDGAAYNPATDTWRTLAAGTPDARDQHVAVWAGSEMVVWGGFVKGLGLVGSGGRYDPQNDVWKTMATNTFGGRIYEPAVWSGTYFIVCAGSDGSSYQHIALLYELANDQWYFQDDGNPSGRWYPSAVWTGTEMVLWGGLNASGSLNDGGRLNPNVLGGKWIPVTTSGAPAKREGQTAVWTGSEMIVWGGSSGNVYLQDGGRYNPARDSWTAMTTPGAPTGRINHTAVWTGNEMVIFGGRTQDSVGDTTYSYQPSQGIYLYVKQ